MNMEMVRGEFSGEEDTSFSWFRIALHQSARDCSYIVHKDFWRACLLVGFRDFHLAGYF
jgi:hypothetical protein